MDTLSLLQEAIENKKSIEFKYIKPGKVTGVRTGDPHAIFIHQTTSNPTVDIFQTDGDSDTRQSIPGWRPFILEYIHDIKILDTIFEIAEGYNSNPETGKYIKVIAKVE